jgi:hypothetical protein
MGPAGGGWSAQNRRMSPRGSLSTLVSVLKTMVGRLARS